VIASPSVLLSGSWLIAIAFLLLAASAFSGYVSHGTGSREIYTVTAWLLYVLSFFWMKADAKQRSVQPPPGAIPLIPWLLPIAIPYYLVATRRGWRGAASLCFAALFVAVLKVHERLDQTKKIRVQHNQRRLLEYCVTNGIPVEGLGAVDCRGSAYSCAGSGMMPIAR
jgi:hypothetical protein